MSQSKTVSSTQGIAGGCLRCALRAVEDGCGFLADHYREVLTTTAERDAKLFEIHAHRDAINEHIAALFELAGA